MAVSFLAEKTDIELFDNIISAYKLNIKQFKSSLDDIVQLHNDEKSHGIRLDDVTIERVKINAKQLNESLEQHTKARDTRKMNQVRYESARKEPQIENSVCCRFNSINEVEKSLQDFYQTAEFKCRNTDTTDDSNRIQVDNIAVERENFRKIIEQKLNPSIRPKQINPDKIKKSDLLDQQTKAAYYNFYYNFYFFHYYRYVVQKHVYKQ
jgi:hypothetical protein